ncbi:helix-turn-helix domain-containing protein [Pedobacter hiemivivus]|uniref:AraC family transcriptional regulator n=1 Tax=Pedobacter hiemivivus TaxID=2530454 RepID=A0A4R0MV52_9SPHI|nr:helix-turn-helix domain-containing protein [Pedobacter hiemivivus]TCC91039.1 AraC family transcriptional regulator [Pedobacter hiemivivus]
MKFREIQPPLFLKDYVRYFWVLESSDVGELPKTFGAIADGSPGIIFQQSEHGSFYQNHKELPSVFLYGQTTRYTQLHSPGSFRTIGVYFYPHALKSIFGFNAAELTNSCLDVDLIPSTQFLQLSERLLNTPEPEEQIDVLSTYLFSQIEKNRRFEDPIAQYAVAEMLKVNGAIDLKLLLANLKITERSFERRFKYDVGIPPKLLSRIIRFQASMELLRGNKYNKLSDIAFENNYADQSHFIRSFKEFAGISPNQYQKQYTELVENFPEMKS